MYLCVCVTSHVGCVCAGVCAHAHVWDTSSSSLCGNSRNCKANLPQPRHRKNLCPQLCPANPSPTSLPPHPDPSVSAKSQCPVPPRSSAPVRVGKATGDLQDNQYWGEPRRAEKVEEGDPTLAGLTLHHTLHRHHLHPPPPGQEGVRLPTS